MSYPKTGYSRGRPRKGEIRPPSPRNIIWQRWRRKRIAKDPSYLKVLAKRFSDWREENLERSNEISRNARLRRIRRKEYMQEFLENV